MKYIYDENKNKWLKEQRGVGFEDIISAIDQGCVLNMRPHNNLQKYPNQDLALLKSMVMYMLYH